MPLTETEARQLRQLLAKASEPSAGAEDGEFTLIPEAARDCRGAMTDGSKRREDPNVSEPGFKRVDAKAPSGYLQSSSASPPWKLSPDGPMSSMDHLDLAQEAFESARVDGKTICLPPGVPSAEVCTGQTLITAGRFKGANMSYADKDPSVLQCKQWCSSCAFSLSGTMRDLAQYLAFMTSHEVHSQVSDGPVIPGSDLRRQN